jgi:replicative DNA helicase
MDEITGGGGGRKELGVVIAPTGVGKSMVLVHLGANAVKAGLTVVHYTLELRETVIASRYDSCITGIPLDELMDRKEEIREMINDFDGTLIVKEYPTKTATTNTIRAHLEKLKQQSIVPDMIIVDYADLLRTVSARNEKREELESIYEELRSIMMEHNVVGWTASQTNRTGLQSEIITMQSISEAFNKCFVADFIFSVSRTADDKQSNGGRIYIAKNRNGPDGLVYSIFMDTANIDIKVLGRYNPEEHNTSPTLSDGEKKEYLSSKYKKLMKGAIM